MAVTLNASTSTGLVQSADTSGIITLQNNGTNAVTVDSGNLQFNSGYGSVATAYGCRAWVNFNGTGTVAIRASGNVSSITDSGVGVYIVNFTTAITDGNYDFNASCYSGSGGEGDVIWTYSTGTLGTTGLGIACGVPGTAGVTGYTARDNAVICVSIFR